MEYDGAGFQWMAVGVEQFFSEQDKKTSKA
jgi:hypothetical protein